MMHIAAYVCQLGVNAAESWMGLDASRWVLDESELQCFRACVLCCSL